MTRVRHLVDEDELLERLGFTRLDTRDSRRCSRGDGGDERGATPLGGNADGTAGERGVAALDSAAATPAADQDDDQEGDPT